VLPVDIVVADGVRRPTAPPETVVPADAIPADKLGLDIGPKSGELFARGHRGREDRRLERSDGRLRATRSPAGTKAVAQALVDIDGFSVVGGGDSAAAVRTLGFDEAGFGHISTGGGASLEYLEGKTLPGIAVLEA
jgi:phosphoglycerate kinase